MSRNSSFRAKLEARPTVGVVLQSASPLVAHSMSAAGFDWLVIDPINSPLSQLESLGMQTAVGDGNPTPVLMRVGGPTDRSAIQQATDTGAAGVLVPNVRSAADVVMARRPTLYPPSGDRSLFAPVRAHHKEGVQVHFFRANRQYIVNIQYIRGYKTLERVKLAVEVNCHESNHSIVVSQETAPYFRKWINEN